MKANTYHPMVGLTRRGYPHPQKTEALVASRKFALWEIHRNTHQTVGDALRAKVLLAGQRSGHTMIQTIIWILVVLALLAAVERWLPSGPNQPGEGGNIPAEVKGGRGER